MELGSERRRAKRHCANPSLTFREQKLEVKNISTTGIGFYCNEALETGKIYTIDLAYPPEKDIFEGVSVSLDISIRYCKPDTIRGKTLVGAKFENLDENSREILNKFTFFLQQFNKYRRY